MGNRNIKYFNEVILYLPINQCFSATHSNGRLLQPHIHVYNAPLASIILKSYQIHGLFAWDSDYGRFISLLLDFSYIVSAFSLIRKPVMKGETHRTFASYWQSIICTLGCIEYTSPQTGIGWVLSGIRLLLFWL